jgi:hypothetical protein
MILSQPRSTSEYAQTLAQVEKQVDAHSPEATPTINSADTRLIITVSLG